jgi:lysophospholipase L1-like esterase
MPSLVKNCLSFFKYLSVLFVTTGLLLIIGHHLLWVVHIAARGFYTGPDPRASSPVYKNFRGKEKLWEEFLYNESRFAPYYYWRTKSLSGEFINVSSEGIRKTVKNPAKGAKKVFLFGGSTAWGTGAPDDSTIPSIMNKHLGKDYNIINFGESGYVSTQELNYLLERLTNNDIPDLVVFYDGVNDIYAGTYSPAIPRDPQNMRTRWGSNASNGLSGFLLGIYLQSNYRLLFNKLNIWDKSIESQIEKNSKKVISNYEAHIRQVKALEREYGFKSFFFWQPYLFSLTRDVKPYEQEIIKRKSPVLVKAMRESYLVAKKQFSNREQERIFFIGNVLDNYTEPIYIDWCHLGPNGNSYVGKIMADRIESSN